MQGYRPLIGRSGQLDSPTHDSPEVHFPRDRRRALAEGRTLPDRVQGAGLFADISGFTPLTEALLVELGPQRGPEELHAHLDRVFEAVVDEVHRYGGEVLYFSGDAITCWFDGDDALRAATCGLAITAAMQGVRRAVTPNGTVFELAIKVAIAAGPARRFVVGDPDIQLIDVLAGPLVDELAETEQTAGKGEVVVSASAAAALGERAVIDGGRLVALAHPASPVPAPPPVHLDEAEVRRWVLPEVYERLASGQETFLAELRPAYPVFVRFGGIDLDADDAAPRLDGFIRAAQGALRERGGNLLNLTIGDKGAYFFAAFGTPIAHDDDAARACAAALDLLALEATTAARDVQVGVAYGRLRSGTYGHSQRRTFSGLGDPVNLSARLMAKAPPGSAYLADDVCRAAGERFDTELVGDLTVKGKAEPVRVHALLGVRRVAPVRELRYPLPMVGRDAELTAILEAADRSARGSAEVVAVIADPGSGKSRLVAEVARHLRTGRKILWGEAQTFGRSSSYQAWQSPWRDLFGLDDDQPLEEQRRQVLGVVSAIDHRLLARAPLLGAVLGIDLPDNELTSGFSAKLRKESLESLLLDLLVRIAMRSPILVVLEDAHLLDPLSRDLLLELVRGGRDLPVLWLLAARPDAVMDDVLGLDEHVPVTALRLDELASDDARAVVAAKAAQLFGEGTVPAPALVDLVLERAQGSPFHLEELLGYVHDVGLDPTDPQVVDHLDVPDSLHRLVLGRIDLLDDGPRTAVKVASVAGRTFESPFVQAMHPALGGGEEVERQLETAAGVNLVVREIVDEPVWLFRHAVTREVAYDSLPFALRTRLHQRAAEVIEAGGPDAVEQRLDLLAHHAWLGEDPERQRAYLVRAGNAAQERYANEMAADYYRRALPVIPEVERPPTLRSLGKVLQLTGAWADAEAAFAEARDLATAGGDRAGAAWAEADLGEALRRQGRFDEARTCLNEATEHFEAVGDDAGIGVTLHVRGTIAAQQGRYDDARARYEASLAIRRRLGDRAAEGSLLSNLALVAEYEGDLDAAEALNEQALAVRREVGERWAIAISLNNLGMMAYSRGDHALATERFEAAMAMATEVGDRWLAALADHNLGNAAVGLGASEAAREHFAGAYAVYAANADEWSLAMLAEDAVLLAVATGDLERAAMLVGAADEVRERLDTARPPASQATIDKAFAPHEGWWKTGGPAAVQQGRERGLAVLGELLQPG